MRTPSALAALTMPVLCLTGEEDIVIPSPAIAALAALLPDGRLARVPERATPSTSSARRSSTGSWTSS